MATHATILLGKLRLRNQLRDSSLTVFGVRVGKCLEDVEVLVVMLLKRRLGILLLHLLRLMLGTFLVHFRLVSGGVIGRVVEG